MRIENEELEGGRFYFELAKQTDAAGVLAFYRSLIGAPGCTWHLDYPNQEIIDQDIRDRSLHLLREGEELVAVAAAGPSDELEELQWSSKNPCDLARIGVLLSRQGQGIGSLILRKVMDAVMERGFDGIRMLVQKSNAPALALYAKHGFARCGETRMYGFDFYCYEIVFTDISHSE